jgi:hypothetical protein
MLQLPLQKFITSVLLVIICAISLSLHAQQHTMKNDSVVAGYQMPVAAGLKAKAFYWPIGNGHVSTVLLGTSIGFLKRNSIGCDFNYVVSRDQIDEVFDTSGVRHTEGKESYSKEKAVFFSYRYYFNLFKLQQKKKVTLYVSSYVRWGKVSYYQDQLYPAEFVTKNEKNYAAGIVLGALAKIKNSKRLSMDYALGIFNKIRDTDIQYKENNLLKFRNEKTSNWGMKMDINLYWELFKK